MECGGQSGE
jgi:hypothetical protein